MKTLMALYREREAGLRKALNAAPSVTAAVDILLKELTWLEQVVSGDLTVPQQRALLPMIEVLRASLRGLKEGVRLERIPQQRNPLYHLVQGILGLFGLGAAEKTTATPLWRVRVDSDAYLRHFASGLDTIDRWLATQPTVQAQADHRDLFELIQRLLGDAHSGATDLLLERLEQAPQLLERYGLQYVYYDPRQPLHSAAVRRLFRIEASLDPTQRDPATLVPAVLQGDDVLFRGLVVEPTTVPVR